MFQRLFRRERANRAIVDALYDSIVAAARQPAFYSEFGAPDTPLGRFELITLHMMLGLRRLRMPQGAEIAQEIVDKFFMEVDHSLRELGIGDTSVPKRARKLAKMFYGRTAAYGEALEIRDIGALAAALGRNIRPDLPHWDGAKALAIYVLEAWDALAGQGDDAILAGTMTFPAARTVRPDAA